MTRPSIQGGPPFDGLQTCTLASTIRFCRPLLAAAKVRTS